MRLLPGLACLVLLVASLSAADDPLGMVLSARADSLAQTVQGQPVSSTTPALGPALSVKAGAKLRIQWSVLNGEKAGRLTDVTLHLALDKSGSESTYESALVVDLVAQVKTTGDVVVQAPAQTGDYRLRLETIGAAKAHGHEHTATMAVKVVP